MTTVLRADEEIARVRAPNRLVSRFHESHHQSPRRLDVNGDDRGGKEKHMTRTRHRTHRAFRVRALLWQAAALRFRPQKSLPVRARQITVNSIIHVLFFVYFKLIFSPKLYVSSTRREDPPKKSHRPVRLFLLGMVARGLLSGMFASLGGKDFLLFLVALDLAVIHVTACSDGAKVSVILGSEGGHVVFVLLLCVFHECFSCVVF